MMRFANLLLIISISVNGVVARQKKPWTFLVYAAADNNLRDFAPRNINQMAKVGSNENVNLLVHLDIRLSGSKKMTRRYVVEKNNPVQMDIPNEKTPMNSGDPQTLISAAQWAFNNYPADHYVLVLWDHGTGIIDPYGRRNIDVNQFFHYNPVTHNYELDRTLGFIDLIEALDDRGICWDDSHGEYLTNQKLEFALNEIVTNCLHGKKLDILAFDACLMSMLEVAEISKRYANIQVSSQEVEPGPGWKYDEALAQFAHGAPDARSLATQIVNAFARAYKPSGNHPGFVDYTQSAMDLSMLDALERNVDQVGQLLVYALQSDQSTVYRNVLAQARAKKNLTHFNEPTYVDLYHLYSNLVKYLREAMPRATLLGADLIRTLEEGQTIIKKTVIHSVSGSNLPHAHGISIFFPERKIHPSYKKSNFAKNNWVNFLTNYILA